MNSVHLVTKEQYRVKSGQKPSQSAQNPNLAQLITPRCAPAARPVPRQCATRTHAAHPAHSRPAPRALAAPTPAHPARARPPARLRLPPACASHALRPALSARLLPRTPCVQRSAPRLAACAPAARPPARPNAPVQRRVVAQ